MKRLLLVALVIAGLSSVGAGFASVARADGQAQGIIAAAQAMQSAGYPYCWDGGNTSGPTVGTTDPDPDPHTYANCASIDKVGFDCSGLTLYSVYQGTGHAIALPHLAEDQYEEASKYGGSQISEANLQPGDLIIFDGKSWHVGIVVSGSGTGSLVLSAVSEAWGIRTEPISWFTDDGYKVVGGARYWTTSGSGGGGGGGGGSGGSLTNGSFVQVSGSAAIYVIAGGAPLYVSNWAAVGGSKPTTVISQAQFNSLASVPANGTVLDTTAGVDGGGGVFVVAGGAPLYLSSFSAVSGSSSNGTMVDYWDIANAGSNSMSHLNAVPVNGTVLDTAAGIDGGGGVFVVAGGAPLYLSNFNAVSGSSSNGTMVDYWDIANAGTNAISHLKATPANGTVLDTAAGIDGGGGVFIVAGGAPLYLSNFSAVSGSSSTGTMVDYWDIANAGTNSISHLSATPANGTVLDTAAGIDGGGGVFIVAGGAPLYLSNFNNVPGSSSSGTMVDYWDIANAGTNAISHLKAVPVNGTVLDASGGGGDYVVAGGAPILVTDFGVLHETSSSGVAIDDWDIKNAGDGPSHLVTVPANGTVLLGEPSSTYWVIDGGKRSGVASTAGAVAVDDGSLGAFPLVTSTNPGTVSPGSQPTPICVVPRLAHKTLAQARKALNNAHCSLGKVTRPKHVKRGHVLKVKKQTTKAGSRHANGFKVGITLT